MVARAMQRECKPLATSGSSLVVSELHHISQIERLLQSVAVVTRATQWSANLWLPVAALLLYQSCMLSRQGESNLPL